MIVDTPLFACVQWLVLASVLGPERVELSTTERVAPAPGRVTLVPVGLWRGLPHTAQLFISTWAVNESASVVQEAVAEAGWLARATCSWGCTTPPFGAATGLLTGGLFIDVLRRR